MSIKLNKGAEEIIALLEQNNHKAYAVGGSIRDQIMGKEPVDFDITTDATAEEMLNIFADYRTLTTGIKHGTVGVIIDKEVFECTAFRIDGKYSDSRHPDSVIFSRNLNDDLSRRDFTVNALCYNRNDGLIDLFGGINDINNKVIRCIGEPEKRFEEDALRILRGMRFASTLGFSIDEATKNAMIKCSPLLNDISKERITEEFRKMLVGENLKYVLDETSSVIEEILPKVVISEQLKNEITTAAKNFEYRMALILKANSDKTDIFDKFRFSNATALSISELSQISIPKSKVELKQMLNRFKEENVANFIRFSDSKSAVIWHEEITENNECYSLDKLAVSGCDIIAFGYKSREVGRILKLLLDKVIKDEIPNNKDELLKAVR